jgi:multidrug resistance efflux pump
MRRNTMRKRLLWGVILIILAGVVTGVLWLRRGNAGATAPEVLKTGEVTVSMRRTSQVVAKTSGRVARVLVTLQDRVTEGQLLAVMDQMGLQRAVEQAQIGVDQAQIALETAQRPADPEQIRLAELALKSAAEALELARIGTQTAAVDANALIVQAQRQREQAFIQLRDATDGAAKERAQTALEQAEGQERIAHLNAQLTQESADGQYRAAQISYSQAKANLDTLTKPPDEDIVKQRALDLQKATLSLRQAQRTLGDSELRAPHPGVVATIQIDEGTVQRAGDPAFAIVDDSEVYVDTTIDEIDIGPVVPGQDVLLTADTYPDAELAGVVESIAPASTNMGGLVAYRVRIRALSTDGLRLMDGMAVNAQITVEILTDRLLAPSWAVRRDQGTAETYCLRLVAGTVERAPVQLGQSNELFAEVVDGLAAGDTVVLVAEERSLFGNAPSGPMGFGGGGFMSP